MRSRFRCIEIYTALFLVKNRSLTLSLSIVKPEFQDFVNTEHMGKLLMGSSFQCIEIYTALFLVKNRSLTPQSIYS